MPGPDVPGPDVPGPDVAAGGVATAPGRKGIRAQPHRVTTAPSHKGTGSHGHPYHLLDPITTQRRHSAARPPSVAPPILPSNTRLADRRSCGALTGKDEGWA
ncbi:hypothetical protein GCM10010383_35660 [Streptomyces lomondensis]|uniref:Uncharacterized protein n=1 Tax=Streptomyces lomondensis TaxID=68229 RepID=A0ABQ2X6Q8_9ACTN|nr:hypothetical protein GCM10010383_35660 [Streptomyces lomondensis]